MDVEQLPKLRSLGRSEQLSAVSHAIGFFHNVGVSAHYSMPTTTAHYGLQTTIYAALANLIHRHAILSAIPVNEDLPDAYWVRLPSIDLASCVTFLTRSQSFDKSKDDQELDKILQEQHNTNFKSNYGSLPFWRVVILRDTETGLDFTASFIFHHSIGDGATGLIFHKFFRGALDAATSSNESLANISTLVQSSSNVQLLPTLEELHPLPLNENPVDFRNKGLEEWTAAPIQLPCHTHYRSLYLSSASSSKFAQRCKQNSLTVTSGLQAILAHSLFDVLPQNVSALTGIIPINLRPWLNLHKGAADNAMGSFIDAIKVQTQRSHFEPNDNNPIQGLPAAHHASQAITHYLTGNPSPSGEPYTSVAFFKAIPDVAAAFKSMLGTNRDAAFEVSNLGRFGDEAAEAADSQWRVGRMTFSRSAVAFGAALNTSVVSGGDGALTIGFSWQEGVVDDALVEAVVGGFKKYFDSESF
ncbi:hypothetical protein yc1106_04102 [Curvularia clavata]|uniref:Alcohol acetyltransferase n=1 Tax=Curvularia clavata TaxID=95742 RepID=A0A9Q8Z9P1_CURCL|nr:hypothetical protein yc1106_04102 [Curvularia clavata]